MPPRSPKSLQPAPDVATAHALQDASAWVQRWSHLVQTGATVLDVACGSGRHLRWFAQRGCRVTGVDRDAEAVAPSSGLAEIVLADIEAGPWPFATRRFDVVVVTNYLWRERFADIAAAVAPGGLLMYETFGLGNETVGKPSNPKFLLQPGELLGAAAAGGLRVLAFEDGFETVPERFVQRIVAVREPLARTSVPARHLLLSDRSFAQVKSRDSEDSA
jgi:SAM-dependent methyltransferase